jgi:hypothetical protein
VKILMLAPHPFYQARGTPIAVKTVLEFLSDRGHQVDVLTYHEGSDVDIANVRIFRIPRVPGCDDIRPGFSFKKLICDAVMAEAASDDAAHRYDLMHAVEEAAFIAAAMKAIAGVPYVYDMDSSLAEQMVDSIPRLEPFYPMMRRIEGLAIRRSAGVLTVCAALEAVALSHAPGATVGRVEDTTLLPERAADRALTAPTRDGGLSRRDVRRKSGALSGNRPAAGGVPAHRRTGAPRQAGDRRRTGGRHHPLSRPR